MFGIFANVMRTATRRTEWDAPETWRGVEHDREMARRRAEEELRREMLIRSGR